MMKSWWKPPKLRVGEGSQAERHATWLELFYDLVFVVAIAQVTHNLYEDVSLLGFLGFIVLFVPIWWAWIGTTFYATRFDSDDLVDRFLTALQMVAVAAIAVNVHHGLGESSAGFALSYTGVRAVLVMKYLRTIRHVPVARPMTTRYVVGFTLAAFIWLVSAFVAIPARFILWALGLFVDFATPLSAGKLHTQLPPDNSHLPERMGLFTIIVLGESVAAVVRGVAEQEWNVSSVIAAVLGLSIVFSLWWVYFENIGGSTIRLARNTGHVVAYQAWLYCHLPLMIGIAATGVGVEHIVLSQIGKALPDAQRWLLCGAVALCMLALGILHLTGIIKRCHVRSRYRIGTAAFVIFLAVTGTSFLPVMLIGLVALVCALQIVLELYQSSLSEV
jgi:low temperature requirement protein LtrA